MRGEDLAIDRPSFPSRWRAWPVRLVIDAGEPLLYELADGPLMDCSPRANIFERFLKLASDDDDAVAAFASEYGLLGLCHCGYPTSTCWRLTTRQRGVKNRLLPLDAERPEHWRNWARRFASVLQIARDLRANRHPSELLVDSMLDGLDSHVQTAYLKNALTNVDEFMEELKRAEAVHYYQTHVFCRFLNTWQRGWVGLTNGGVSGSRLRWVYGPNSLFGELAWQLALVASGVKEVPQVCVNCLRMFRPKRRPTPGRDTYCERPACCVRAAQREASRRYRERRRLQKVGV